MRTECVEVCLVEVLDRWGGEIAHVPAFLLEMCHDPLQRTFAGLHMHMMVYRKTENESTPMDTPLSVLIVKPKQSTLLRPTSGQIQKLKRNS